MLFIDTMIEREHEQTLTLSLPRSHIWDQTSHMYNFKNHRDIDVFVIHIVGQHIWLHFFFIGSIKIVNNNLDISLSIQILFFLQKNQKIQNIIAIKFFKINRKNL